MIEEITSELVMLLIEEKGYSMEKAFNAVYNSDTFTRLTNLRTELFSQSTPYVYEFLENELLTGKVQ